MKVPEFLKSYIRGNYMSVTPCPIKMRWCLLLSTNSFLFRSPKQYLNFLGSGKETMAYILRTSKIFRPLGSRSFFCSIHFNTHNSVLAYFPQQSYASFPETLCFYCPQGTLAYFPFLKHTKLTFRLLAVPSAWNTGLPDTCRDCTPHFIRVTAKMLPPLTAPSRVMHTPLPHYPNTLLYSSS